MGEEVEEEEEVLALLLLYLQVEVVLEADLLDVLEEAWDTPEEETPAQRPGAAEEACDLVGKIPLFFPPDIYEICVRKARHFL